MQIFNSKGSTNSEQQNFDARNNILFQAFEEGATMLELAAKFNLSRERVRQIIAKGKILKKRKWL